MDFSKQKEIQIEKPQIIKPSFEYNTTLPYLGRNYDLQVIIIFRRINRRKN